MKYNKLGKVNKESVYEDEYGNYLYEDTRNGKLYVKVKRRALAVIGDNGCQKYIVNQYLFPLDIFVKVGYGNIHLNATGFTFLDSINKYQIDDESKLSIYRKVDVDYDKNDNVRGVHYHNEVPKIEYYDKNNKPVYEVKHDKFHRLDNETKVLLKKMRKLRRKRKI